jgi:hypothetical protein
MPCPGYIDASGCHILQLYKETIETIDIIDPFSLS